MKFDFLTLFSLTMMMLSGCFFKPDEVHIEGLDRQDAPAVSSQKADVSSFAIIDNQLVINGTNLDNVTNVRLTGPSNFDQAFTIESKTTTNLVANGIQGISLAVGAIFSLVITDVSGASTFPVTFTLQDGAVSASALDSMGAAVGQILKYDGTTWIASDLPTSTLDSMGANIGQILKYDGTTWVASDLGSLTFAGNWNANANSPNLLVDGSLGEYYIVNTAGTIDLLGGPGTSIWQIGDWVVWNEGASRWEKVDNATSVTSFNGRNGPVVSLANDYTWNQIDKATSSIGDIADVDTTGVAAEKVLKYDGVKWIIADYGGGSIPVNSISSAEINDGSITDADLAGSISQAKIIGLVSDLAAKLPLAGGTMTGNIDFSGTETVDGVDVSALKDQSDSNVTNIATNVTSIAALPVLGTAAGDALNISSIPNCSPTQKLQMSAGPVFTLTCVTDTDANTLCAAGEYLDGDGTCITVDATAVGLANVSNVAQMPLAYLDIDDTLAADSDTKVVSQKAIKAYVAANVGAGDFKADGTVAMTGDFDLGNNKALFKSDNANYVELIAPNALAATYTLTYPASAGSSGQLLSTNGAGVLSWVAVGETGDFKADGTVAMTGNLTTSGLIDGVDVAALKTQSDTNVTDIASNVTDIATNVTNIATNVTNIAALPSLGTAAGDTLDISSVPNCTATQKLQMSAVAPFTFSCVTDYDTDTDTNASTLCAAGKYLDGDGNCITVDATAVGLANVTNVAQMPLAYLDTDNTLAADSDIKVASQKAIKAYIAANTGTGDFKADGSVAMTGDFDLGNNKALFKSDNANYVELIAPNALAATYTLTYPASAGSSGQLLSTNGAGVLSWVAVGGTGDFKADGTVAMTGNLTTSGLIDGVDVAALKTQSDTNVTDIASNVTDVATNVTNIATNATNIAALPSLGTAAGDTLDISSVPNCTATQKLQMSAVAPFTFSCVTDYDTDTNTNASTLCAAGKYLDGDGNCITVDATAVGLANVTNVAQMPLAYLDTDNTLAADSDIKVASQKAIKAYIAANTGTGDFKADGSVAMTGDFDLGNNKALFKSDNANYVELIAPNALAATYTLTYPASAGSSGQLLSTNGTGVLSWVAAGGTGDFKADGTVAMTGNLTTSGLIDGVDVAALKTQSDTNVTNIASNVTDIATNVTDIATNVTNIAALPSLGTAAGDTLDISSVPNCTASQKLQMSAVTPFTFSCVTDYDTDTDTNTNANTICAAGKYLDGDGTCITVDATAVGLANVTNNAQMPLAYLDTDNTLAADSDTKVPSQKAIKAYVAANAGTVTSIDAGTGLTGGTITTSGTINIDVGVGNNQMVQLNGTAQLPAVDGSLLTNLPAQSATGSASGDLTGSYPAPTLATSGVTAGTYTKITVDAKGRATVGASLAATDIPNLDAVKITSGTLSAARIPAGTDSTKLALAGGTMSGAIAMGTSKITGLAAGTATDDAATKGQMETYVDASTDEMKTKTAGTYNRDNHSLEALRNELDAMKVTVDSISSASGAYTWNVISSDATLAIGNSYTISVTAPIILTLPASCTASENLQIINSSSHIIRIFSNTSQKIFYQGEQDVIHLTGLMTLKISCSLTDSKWVVSETSSYDNITAGDVATCGDVGDNCYDNTNAVNATFAATPSSKYLNYIDTGNGNFVWKEYEGTKILKANGLDEWQMTLDSAGTSFTASYLTDETIIAGRACPDKVYISDSDKFNEDSCLYYDTGVSASDFTELGSWVTEKWYYGNHSICAGKGMRVPTIYETTSNDFTSNSDYPVSDGTPGYAGTGYDPTKGVPDETLSTWSATTNSFLGTTSSYYTWSGSSDTYTNNSNAKTIRCVVP